MAIITSTKEVMVLPVSMCWLVGWLVGRSFGWLVGRQVGWIFGWLVSLFGVDLGKGTDPGIMYHLLCVLCI